MIQPYGSLTTYWSELRPAKTCHRPTYYIPGRSGPASATPYLPWWAAAASSMAGHQINARRSLIPPTEKKQRNSPSIRVVARQSDGIPRVASESEADPSGPPACAERAGAETQSRSGVGCFLRGHMRVHRELKRGRSADRFITTKQVTLNCKHAAEKKVGLCVGITYRHWECLGGILCAA